MVLEKQIVITKIVHKMKNLVHGKQNTEVRQMERFDNTIEVEWIFFLFVVINWYCLCFEGIGLY